MGATLFGATSNKAPEQPGNRRQDNLAIVFQNVLTVIVRLRTNRQVITDAQAFRLQMQNALRAAEKEGVSKLYPAEDVRLATFAVVAFLDESILNSSNPAFSDWPRMPLQEEMFGQHRAGEVFFENIERLLTRTDSNGAADLLEVYSLCVLLGYKGKFGLGENDSVRPVLDAIAEKVRRVRGPLPGLSPAWAVPEGVIRTAPKDPWVRGLAIAAFICVFLALLSVIFFKVVLNEGVSYLRELAAFVNW